MYSGDASVAAGEPADDDEYYMEKMAEILDAYPKSGPPRHPVRLTPHMYIGNQDNADDEDLLQTLEINHVLNMAGTRNFDLTRSPYKKHVGVKRFQMIPAEDYDEYDISQHFIDAIAFIGRAEDTRGQALVHCNYGVNRSGAVVAAYIMVAQRKPLLRVITDLKSKRKLILSNLGFRRQLIRFARARGLLDPVEKPPGRARPPLSSSSSASWLGVNGPTTTASTSTAVPTAAADGVSSGPTSASSGVVDDEDGKTNVDAATQLKVDVVPATNGYAHQPSPSKNGYGKPEVNEKPFPVELTLNGLPLRLATNGHSAASSSYHRDRLIRDVDAVIDTINNRKSPAASVTVADAQINGSTGSSCHNDDDDDSVSGFDLPDALLSDRKYWPDAEQRRSASFSLLPVPSGTSSLVDAASEVHGSNGFGDDACSVSSIDAESSVGYVPSTRSRFYPVDVESDDILDDYRAESRNAAAAARTAAADLFSLRPLSAGTGSQFVSGVKPRSHYHQARRSTTTGNSSSISDYEAAEIDRFLTSTDGRARASTYDGHARSGTTTAASTSSYLQSRRNVSVPSFSVDDPVRSSYGGFSSRRFSSPIGGGGGISSYSASVSPSSAYADVALPRIGSYPGFGAATTSTRYQPTNYGRSYVDGGSASSTRALLSAAAYLGSGRSPSSYGGSSPVSAGSSAYRSKFRSSVYDDDDLYDGYGSDDDGIVTAGSFRARTIPTRVSVSPGVVGARSGYTPYFSGGWDW